MIDEDGSVEKELWYVTKVTGDTARVGTGLYHDFAHERLLDGRSGGIRRRDRDDCGIFDG